MRELFKWASVLDRSYSSYLDKKLAEFNINSSQYFYILRICDNPGITQDSIFQTTYRSPSNITRALAQLETKGYLTKDPSRADKRTYHLYPTDKAVRDYDKILSIILDCVEELLSPFSQEERLVFLKMLRTAGENAFALNKNEKERTEEFMDEANIY